MKKSIYFLVPILICFLVGFIGSSFQADALATWYPMLNKSPLTPPNYVFPVAWSILYLCMGISIGFILNSRDHRKNILIMLFSVQLFLNFIWSILFFYFESPLLGLIDILLLDVFVFSYAINSYPVRKVSSVLFIPYIIWILFATYLNGYILYYN